MELESQKRKKGKGPKFEFVCKSSAIKEAMELKS
jgi:hypothetical protein